MVREKELKSALGALSIKTLIKGDERAICILTALHFIDDFVKREKSAIV